MPPKKKKPSFEVGQTLYVSISSWLVRSEEPKLYEYVVTRFNKTSVYARPKEHPTHSERRFEIRTMTAKDGFGDYYYAYIDPEVYWKSIRDAEERKNLRNQIKNNAHTLNLEQLRQVDEFIQSIIKM